MVTGVFAKIPCRYILACIGAVGIGLNYAMRVNLSVAIVAMVKSSGDDGGTSSSAANGSCPAPHTNVTTSTTIDGEFSWDEEIQGHVLSAYFYGYLSSQVLGGFLAQRFGGRLVFGPGVFISGVLSLLSPIAVRTHLYLFFAVRILAGFSSGMVMPAAQSMISWWYPPNERSTFSAIMFSGCNAGPLVGMALTGVLVQASGWPVAFYFFGGLSVLWFVPWLYYVYSTPDEHPRISPEEKEYIAKARDLETSVKTESLPVPWLSIFTSVPVWAYILYDVGVEWLNYTMLSDLPTYLKNILHFDVQQSGVISALPYLFAWVFGTASGWASQKLRTKDWMTHLATYRIFNGISSLGSAVCLVCITLVGCDTISVLALLVLANAANFCSFGGSYFNNLDLSPNFTGPLIGINYTCLNLLGVIAPVVVGTLTKGQQTLGQWAKVFYIAAGLACASFIIFFFFGSVDAQPWNNPKKKDKDPDRKEDDGNV